MTPRISGARLANAIAWAAFALLAAAAVKITAALGPVGLILLGGATWMVCSLATMDETAPGWGQEVFRANMQRPRTPEARAARHAEQAGFRNATSFFARCGMALAAAGLAAFCWQSWRG